MNDPCVCFCARGRRRLCVRMSTRAFCSKFIPLNFILVLFAFHSFIPFGPCALFLLFWPAKWINISNVSSIDERTIILNLKGKRLINTSVYIFRCRFIDAVVIFVIGKHSGSRLQIGKKSQKLNTNKCVAGEMRKYNTRTLI